MKNSVLLAVALILAAVPAHAQVNESQMDAMVDLLRSDIKTEKVAMINHVMDFTADQSAIFWPIYQEYDRDRTKLMDLQRNLLKDYAQSMAQFTDLNAKELVKRSFKLQEEKMKLRKKYFSKFASKLGEAQAAKFVLLDTQIGMLTDLQMSTNLPLMKADAPAPTMK